MTCFLVYKRPSLPTSLIPLFFKIYVPKWTLTCYFMLFSRRLCLCFFLLSSLTVFSLCLKFCYKLVLSIRGNKRPTGCNRIFLLQNLLSPQHLSDTILPIIRSSRVIQMVAACGKWRFGLQVVGLVWSCRLCVRVAGCCSELLMMGIMVPETCSADNKFWNKDHYVASSWPFYFHVLTTMQVKLTSSVLVLSVCVTPSAIHL